MDHSPQASITTLPPELLYPIIQGLDPASLISLSQANKFFRWFINPQRTHFVQRLLALELLPEHGGLVPSFHARENKIIPWTDDPAWDTNRYACPGCLRLLTHRMFDNHSILGLALRKPPPGSEEATRLTDWEPLGDEAARWKRIQAHNNSERQRLLRFRSQYTTATRSDGDGVHNNFLAESDDEDSDEDDRQAEEAEKVLCGRSRHRRLCLECKRSRGVYARRTRCNVGTSDVPIILTRQVHAPDEISLFFPRSLHGVPEPPRPRVMRVLRPGCTVALVTPVVVFCPGCSTWQDMLAFRKHSLTILHLPADPTSYWNRDPEDSVKAHYSRLRCNHCLASDLGIEALGKELLQLFGNLADRSLSEAQGRLIWGWQNFIGEFFQSPSSSHGLLNQDEYRDARDRIFGPKRKAAMLRCQKLCDTAYGPAKQGTRKIHTFDAPAREAAKELSRLLNDLRKFLRDEVKPAHRAEVTDSWQGAWLEDYEDHEQIVWYTHHILASVRNNPQRLVDYALHPDRFRYPRPPLSALQLDILAREKVKEPEENLASINGRFRYRPPDNESNGKTEWKDAFTKNGQGARGHRLWRNRDDGTDADPASWEFWH
ncbi:hypothetical protein V8F20_010830 [Naviculisporaceae sp. PSN 640]